MTTCNQAPVMSPEMAIELLNDGNTRFMKNQTINRNLIQEVQATKEKQSPFAVVVSCMDSRTSPEIIFDRGLGDIFSIRLAGNVITPEVIASVEYACAAVGSKAVVVLGHTGCGAIQGTINKVQLGHLSFITNRIQKCMDDHSSVEDVTKKNVLLGLKTLENDSAVLKELISLNQIKVIGGIYDISTGEVTFMDAVDGFTDHS